MLKSASLMLSSLVALLLVFTAPVVEESIVISFLTKPTWRSRFRLRRRGLLGRRLLFLWFCRLFTDGASMSLSLVLPSFLLKLLPFDLDRRMGSLRNVMVPAKERPTTSSSEMAFNLVQITFLWSVWLLSAAVASLLLKRSTTVLRLRFRFVCFQGGFTHWISRGYLPTGSAG